MTKKIIRTYKFRIYPTKRQAQTLTDHLAICCELYNAALQERRDAWKLNRKSISRYDQRYQLREIRQVRPDVKAVNSYALEDVIGRVDRAFAGFFTGIQQNRKVGYPRFRSFRRYDSITFRQIGKALAGNKLRLPKVGNLRIKLHRPVEGKIKTLTVRRDAGKWFALFACEVEAVPLPFNPNMIGIDVGLTHFATLSDGTQIANPRHYRNAECALRVAQRRVARRRKGSHRRQKAVALLQRIYARVRSQRADFQHGVSAKLVAENGLIAVEDLNVKGLAGGMLAKSVHDAGWGYFMLKLAYKAENAGRVFVKVDPRGTSQICTCGASVPKTLADRWHDCSACGLSLPRDHVSALVILARVGPSGANAGSPCVA